jgi:hypothetical protein
VAQELVGSIAQWKVIKKNRPGINQKLGAPRNDTEDLPAQQLQRQERLTASAYLFG